MGKGEIARNKQFLLSPQCFMISQIIVFPFVHIFDLIILFTAELEEPKIDIRGEGLTLGTLHYHNELWKIHFVGKRKNAGCQDFLLFLQCFISFLCKFQISLKIFRRRLWKNFGKSRISWWPAFSAFPTTFATLSMANFKFSVMFNLWSENAFISDKS